MTHRLTNNYAKNYCNRTLIVKVIVGNVVTCFFGTQCSSRGYHHLWSARLRQLSVPRVRHSMSGSRAGQTVWNSL